MSVDNTLAARVERFKRFVIAQTIKETGGNKRAAADRLDCSRNTINRYSERVGQKKPHRKAEQIAKDQLRAYEVRA